MIKLLAKHYFEDICLLFVSLGKSASLVIVPNGTENNICLDSFHQNDSMIQLCLSGDYLFRNYSPGQSMKNSETVQTLEYLGQQIIEIDDKIQIITKFENDKGIEVNNYITYQKGSEAFESKNVLINNSGNKVCVEMFASFCLSGLNPYENKAEEDLILHRVRGNWSAEGRLESRTMSQAGLEQSWADYGLRLEKFGSIGSMPIQKFFPFSAVESQKSGVTWGAMIEAPASWQMEVYRYNDKISLSGGAADFEYGHVRKDVEPGGILETFSSIISVCTGGIDDICSRLTSRLGERTEENQNDKCLPVIFNEYCASWGNPDAENIKETVDAIKDFGIKYFVIDAGWYRDGENNWANSVGDWKENKKYFPEGLKESTNYIIKAGMIPGIWFEMEIAADKSEIFNNDGLFLTRDGKKIIVQDRSFFDFRKQEALDYLEEKLIKMLKYNGFGYIKFDYNECLGIGCDGAESYGAGLIEHIGGVMRFYENLKKAVPGLVIEVCSAGGHRIEPKFMSLGNMVSFSDAHECYEGAVVAANILRVCPAKQNQIWAVVKKEDCERELVNTISKVFFGRYCLSGYIQRLQKWQIEKIRESIDFYKSVYKIIENGKAYRFGNENLQYRKLEGCQIVCKLEQNLKKVLMVVNTFGNSEKIIFNNPILNGYNIERVFSGKDAVIEFKEHLEIEMPDFSGCVISFSQGG